jgi:hypothetical protein
MRDVDLMRATYYRMVFPDGTQPPAQDALSGSTAGKDSKAVV